MLLQNPNVLSKIVLKYLYSSMIWIGFPRMIVGTVSDNLSLLVGTVSDNLSLCVKVMIISLVLSMLSSRQELPHHFTKPCRAEQWCCLWPESRD